jgi:hypothetical protein
LTYRPAANYSGSDSFTFRANDGKVNSPTATVSIAVTSAGNQAPVANARSATVAEDGSVSVVLTGSDADGDSLTFAVVTSPGHGTLTGTAPNLTYRPAADYNGPDGFTFRVNDGKVNSANATVSITVTAVNDAPVATARLITVVENGSAGLTLRGTDVDGDSLTFAVVASPSHGTLSGNSPNLYYHPTANYVGVDSFTFRANDGTVNSATATVSVTVYSSEQPPAGVSSISVSNNSPATLTWTSIPGRAYQVVVRAKMDSDDWTPASGDIVAESEKTSWREAEPAGMEQRFYMILVLPEAHAETP